MKILVTGATGKVGSRLVRHLTERGDRVRALVRDPARATAMLGKGAEIVKGDLLDPASLAVAVRGVDAVVHAAAFFRGATPEQAHAVNDLGTQHLATAARAAAVRRFVFTSTGLVYGSRGGQLTNEDAPCNPVDAYPVSKLAAERFLLSVEGLDVCVLRLPFVYGDGDPHIEEVVPFMRVFAPTQRMSLGHHADVAQAVMRVLDAPAPRIGSTTSPTTKRPRSPSCLRRWARLHPTAPAPTAGARSSWSSTAAAFARTWASCRGSLVWQTPSRRRRSSEPASGYHDSDVTCWRHAIGDRLDR
jgi:nucleoside-diphosphate-sugar epimerase